MTWPWRREADRIAALETDLRIAHAALARAEGERDQLQKDRDWMREQFRDLMAHLQRVQRAARGMPETPREPKTRGGVAPMPKRLRDYIMSIGNRKMRQDALRVAEQRFRDSGSWDQQMADVFGDDWQEESTDAGA